VTKKTTAAGHLSLVTHHCFFSPEDGAMKLLIYPQISDQDVSRIQAAFPELDIRCPRSEGEALAYVVDADVLYGRITPALLMTAQRLKWVQADCIGMERYLFPELADSPVVLTNVRGVFSDHIANHVWAYILAFARDLPRYIRQQATHDWRPGGHTVFLPECTVGIVGLGGIGQETASRAPAFGCRVIAVDPRITEPPAPVEAVWPPDRLHDLLRASDFVVICAPHTPGTEKMFGAAEFEAMKPTAFLINIGRGVIVDLNALTGALRERKIAGAGLDVYEVEPLPAGHPLWDMDNVVLTPHVAGHGPYVQERRIQVFIENMKRYLKGEEMLTVVDKSQWF
jgi:phosphoglycerate dehydrogenase-like enzyme